MQLNQQTDYAIRTLLYTAYHSERLVTISEIASFFEISRSHLTKIVASLTQRGYLHGIRGKNGGLKLGIPAEDINLGVLIEQFEPLDLVECFSDKNQCVITNDCQLQSVIYQAKRAFLAVLNSYTLADIKLNNPHLTKTITGVTVSLPVSSKNKTISPSN